MFSTDFYCIHWIERILKSLKLKKKSLKLKLTFRNSLEVQWLGLCVSTAGGTVQVLVRELRSCMPHSVAQNKKPYI